MNKYIGISAATLACLLAMTSVQIVNAQVSAPATSAVAQNPAPAPAGHHAHRLAQLAQELGLNANQKSQIKEIMKTSAQQRKSIRTSQLPDDQKKAQLKTLKQTTRKQIAQVLTPEQRAKWKEMHRAHKGANS